MSTRKKQLLGTAIAAAFFLGSIFLYRSLAAGWQLDKVRKLAEEARDLPKDQAKAAFSKVWAEAKKLSPEQRRNLFMEGERTRLKRYFDLSPKAKLAYLDERIKRDLQREAERKKRAAAVAKGKSAASTKGAQAKGAGQGGGPRGPGGGGPGGRNMSPEQRSAQRRGRLDSTSPNDRAMRGQLAADMRDRRKQLGLPPGRWRGGRG